MLWSALVHSGQLLSSACACAGRYRVLSEGPSRKDPYQCTRPSKKWYPVHALAVEVQCTPGPGQIRRTWQFARRLASPTIARESFSSPFFICQPDQHRSRSLASLRCLCVLIRLQSPRRFPGFRLHLLSLFFPGCIDLCGPTRRAHLSLLAAFFHVCETLVLRDVGKKKKNHPHPMARAFED